MYLAFQLLIIRCFIALHPEQLGMHLLSQNVLVRGNRILMYSKNDACFSVGQAMTLMGELYTRYQHRRQFRRDQMETHPFTLPVTKLPTILRPNLCSPAEKQRKGGYRFDNIWQ